MRWLGVSHHVGLDLCYWLVMDSGQVVSKTSVEHVTRDDYLREDGVDLKMLEDLFGKMVLIT